MGFLKNVSLDSGLQITNAYYRIHTLSGSKEEMFISLRAYVNQESHLEGKTHIIDQRYSFVPSVQDGAPNYHKQAYEFLKTLTEFADVVDV